VTDTSALTFVDPAEQDARFRVVLWAAPGEGKSVGAASAPGPILVISADRPGAYRYARKHHAAKTILEVRYEGAETLEHVYRYLRDTGEVRTVIVDPFQHVYDKIVEVAPPNRDGDPDYQWVNKKVTGFLYSLRDFDINLVIVAHEKLNDGKKGDGKLYPALGGPALINRILAESDIVAHVERVAGDDKTPARYEAQLTPIRNLVCKQSTPAELGDRAPLDLDAWFAAAGPDMSDLPFVETEAELAAEGQQTLEAK
jgi:hypothetical protein